MSWSQLSDFDLSHLKQHIGFRILNFEDQVIAVYIIGEYLEMTVFKKARIILSSRFLRV